MKALPIIWRWRNEFAKHVTLAGPFHTSMNYIGMPTNHKMLGSGYKEILFEAQLVTSGSMKGVLTGKAYAKALFCLRILSRRKIERLRRGSSERILLAGPATRKPFNYEVFLENDENKKQLCQLMLRVWSAQQAFVRLQNTEMAVLIVEGKAYQLTPSNGEISFSFTSFHSYCYFHRLYKAMINTYLHFPGRVERASAALQ